jgi:hypothetical protein
VLLSYHLPREPSAPRIALWRRLKQLGVAQLADGLVALPADARTREQLEWVAEEVLEHGGTAGIWLARPAALAQERELAAAMNAARARSTASSRRRRQAAHAPLSPHPPGPARLRRQWRDISRRDFFPPPERDAAAAALRALTERAGDVGRPARPAAAGGGPGEVGHARRGAHRPGRLRLARPPVHRPDADFLFVADLEQVPGDATAFDMRGAELGHQGGDCSFETILHRYDLTDPVLWRIAEVVHEADLDDGRFDAPEAPGLDTVLRGLSLTGTDQETLAVTGPVFDGLYEFYRRSLLLGREPA